MILASESSLKEYSTKGLWGKKTLNRILKEKARKDPGREFFIDPLNKTDLIGIEPERLTYGDVERIVDVLATNFIHLGLEKDDIVVIQLPNTVELLLSYLALWRIGAIASPVPIQWRAHEVDFVLRLTQAKAFITLEEFHGFKHLQLAKELRNKHASLKHIISLPQLKEMCRGGIDQQRLGSNHVDANDIVTVCYTSGTEAEPKACPLSHNNWIFEANILSQACLVDEGCTLIMPAPIVNLTGVVSIIFTIIHHATLVLHHPFDPIVYMTQLVEEKVNFGAAVPAMLVMLLKYPDIEKFDMSNIRSFLTGSAPPAAWTLREFKARNMEPYILYDFRYQIEGRNPRDSYILVHPRGFFLPALKSLIPDNAYALHHILHNNRITFLDISDSISYICGTPTFQPSVISSSYNDSHHFRHNAYR